MINLHQSVAGTGGDHIHNFLITSWTRIPLSYQGQMADICLLLFLEGDLLMEGGEWQTSFKNL